MRGDVQPYDEWGSREPRTALVVIGAADALDRAEIEALLDTALVLPDGDGIAR